MDFKKKIFDEILLSPNHNEQIVSIICSSLNSCSPKEYPRISKILKDIISNNKKEIKKECYKGLPENLPSLRALIWKMNFKYLPHKIQNWNSTLKSYRNEYKELKNAVMMKQKEEMKIFQELKDKNYSEEKKNNEKDFDINQTLYLLAENTDKELLETINKDINRTYCTMNFFLKPIDNKIKFSTEELNTLYTLKKNCIYQDSTSVYTKGRTSANLFNKEIHSDVLERILYIYAKNNKDVGYVQGMNAILAPIYYCYSLDNTCDKEFLEADSFWSFSFLMEDIKQIFQQNNIETTSNTNIITTQHEEKEISSESKPLTTTKVLPVKTTTRVLPPIGPFTSLDGLDLHKLGMMNLQKMPEYDQMINTPGMEVNIPPVTQTETKINQYIETRPHFVTQEETKTTYTNISNISSNDNINVVRKISSSASKKNSSMNNTSDTNNAQSQIMINKLKQV